MARDFRHSYTGSDVRVMVEIPGFGRKQFIECTTLSVSIHREKIPARACGYINPKGFARGKRTIAGTIVLTQFTIDVLFRFLSEAAMRDVSKDTFFKKIDQLPPINMTCVLADEYGNKSVRRLLGVEMVTDGTVYSVNDMYTEETISYMAADFTPLVPEGVEMNYNGPASRYEKTPKEYTNSKIIWKT